MKKVLFVATVDSVIEWFLLPYLKMFKDKGYEVHVATDTDKPIKYCDKKIKLPIKRSPFSLSNFKAIRELKKIVNSEKYEIIHCHTPMGGVATRLIERNTTIPTRKSQIFSTAADNQSAVDINVVQGERQFAKDNKSLGQFRLDGIPPARRGVPQIEVTFDIDANGIVNVSAKDLGTGREQHITITAGSNLSDADIEKAVKEAAEYEAQDKKRKEAVETRNDADSMVFQTEKALSEVGDKIAESDKQAVEADLAHLKELVEKSNPEVMSEGEVADIKAAKEKLMTSAQALFAKVYEQAQGAAGAGPDMGGAAGADYSTPNDDVVDGDYREV